MSHSQILVWVDEYVAAWRSQGTSHLAKIFTDNISYRVSPWKEPILGLAQLGLFWEKARTGPDENFTLKRQIIAVENNTAVVRITVDYAHDVARRWRDLWILEFNEQGLCSVFEEWPFAQGQSDGHKV